MKDFTLIFKLILKNTFRGYGSKTISEKKKKTTMLVVMLVGFLPLVVGICALTYVLASAFANLGAHAEFLAVLIGASQLIIIFFGLQSVLSYTFMSKDNEFLLQLPVKPVTLFTVKFAVIYLEELILSAAILLPCLITYTVAVSSIFVLPVYFYLLIPLIILFAPVIPLLIVNIIAFPLMKLINALKNKSGISLIILTTVFVGFMSAYMIMVPSMEKYFGAEGDVVLTDAMVNMITKTANILYFNKALAMAVCGQSFLINFAIFLLFLIGSVGIVFILSATLFKKSVLSQLESPVTAGKKGINVENESIDGALFKREVKNLFGDLNFAFNSIMGSIMTPLMIGLMGYMGATTTTEATEEAVQITAMGAEYMNLGFLLMFCLITLCGMNYSASLAFSREGKTFYINKYLPLDPMQIIKAKTKLADIISIAGIILTFFVGLIIMKISFLNIILVSVAITMLAFAFNRLDIYRDLKKPNLTWNNANECIKKNFYPIVPVFIGMGLGIGVMILFSVVSDLQKVMADWLVALILWSVVYVVAILSIIFMTKLLNKNAVKLFDKINED